MKKYTVYYTQNDRFTHRFARNFDHSVRTFTCTAVNRVQAVKFLRDSIKYSTKSAKGRITSRSHTINVVRAFFTPPTVRVIPTRQPSWTK